MKIKVRYFEQGVFPRLFKDIDAACKPFEQSFREEPSINFTTSSSIISVRAVRFTSILFVDPKGMKLADYQYKIDGYRELFIDHLTDQLHVFQYEGIHVRVALAMFNQNASESSQGYGDFWYDSPKGILKQLTSVQS